MAKTAISAKLDAELLEKTDNLVRKLKIARNHAIEEGLSMWVEQNTLALLAKQMEEASKSTRKESKLVAHEWSQSEKDGLDDER